MFTGRIANIGSYSIARLDLGTLTVPPGTPMGGRVLPVQAYLVFHPDGVVLFDTGLGEEYPVYDQTLTPVRRPLTEALAVHRVAPSDLAAVVNCHLHYDHCGGNPMFPGIPTFVQSRDYEAGPRLGYYVRERIDYPGVELRILNGEEEILPGIRVLPTPGHTPGHQSLQIEDTDGLVVLAGQAAYTVDEYLDPHQEPARGARTAWDTSAFLDSIRRLKLLSPGRVYFAHDSRHWKPDRG
jgi:glyoxylase-like metal-dependent hydrolase (beta-lactamase superfamily II)